MSGHAERPIPKPVVAGIGAIVAATFALTGSVALGLLSRPRPASEVRAEQGVAVLAQRTLVFTDRADGALVVSEPGLETPVSVVAPNSNQGFIRGVVRSMSRERHMRGVGPETPYLLQLWADGRLSMRDLGTGRTVELDSFGPDNRETFRRLLPGRWGAAA
jgi:putative photosynthetic complex assembly protein